MIIRPLKTLLPSITILMLGTLGCHLLLGDPVYPYIWAAFIYHTLLSLATTSILVKAKKKDGFRFTTTSMGVSMGRLLLSAAVLFAYYTYLRIGVFTFTLAFFIYYFSYIIQEVKFIKSLESKFP